MNKNNAHALSSKTEPQRLHLFGKRVILRRYRSDDATALAKLANNRKIWLNLRDAFPYPYTLQDAKDWISQCQYILPATNFVIEHAGQLVGDISCIPGVDIYRGTAEVGYWIAEPYWGQGLASEALQLFVAYAFDVLQMRRLWAEVFVDNIGSAKALEKAGFQHEGVQVQAALKAGKVKDCIRYGLLAER